MLLWFLFAAACVPLSHAQATGDSATSDSTEALPAYPLERTVLISIKESALRIPGEVGLIAFGGSSSRSAPGAQQSPLADISFDPAEHIQSVRFFAKKRSGGTLVPARAENADVPARQVGRDNLTRAQRNQIFEIYSPGLRSLWARFRPERIQRMVHPPYGEVPRHVRTGEPVRDVFNEKIHYVVVLRKASQRKSFAEAALKLPEVKEATPSPTDLDFDS